MLSKKHVVLSFHPENEEIKLTYQQMIFWANLQANEAFIYQMATYGKKSISKLLGISSICSKYF